MKKKYGNIILEKCNYEVPDLTKDTKYKKSKNNKAAYDEVIKNYRNRIIVNTLVADKRDKIAIIYGAAHYEGVKKMLDSLNQTK